MPGIVEVVAGERRAPILEHPHKAAGCKVVRDFVLKDKGEPQPRQGGVAATANNGAESLQSRWFTLGTTPNIPLRVGSLLAS
jgi:hypothetical protein